MNPEAERMRGDVLSHDDMYTKMAIAFDDFLLALHDGGLPAITEPCCIRGFWHLGAAIELRRKADVLEMKHLMEIAYPEGIVGKTIPNPTNASDFFDILKSKTDRRTHSVYNRKLVNLLVRAFRIPSAAEPEPVVAANTGEAIDAAFSNPLTAAREAIRASIPAAGVEAPPADAGAAAATCVESPALAELVGSALPEQPDKLFRDARRKFVMHAMEAVRMIQEGCRPPIALAKSFDRIMRFEAAVKPAMVDPARETYRAKRATAAAANMSVFEGLHPPFTWGDAEKGRLEEAAAALRGSEGVVRERKAAVTAAEAFLKKQKVEKAREVAAGDVERSVASLAAAQAAMEIAQRPVNQLERLKALAAFFKEQIRGTRAAEISAGPHFGYFYLANERRADVSLFLETLNSLNHAAANAAVRKRNANAAAAAAAAAEAARRRDEEAAAAAAAEAARRRNANAAAAAAAAAALGERNAQNAANRANPFKPGFYPKFIKAGSTLPNGTPVPKELVLARKGNTRATVSGNLSHWVFPGEHGIPLEGGRRRTRRQSRRARKTRRIH